MLFIAVASLTFFNALALLLNDVEFLLRWWEERVRGCVASLRRSCSQSAVWTLLQCEAIVSRGKRLCVRVYLCVCVSRLAGICRANALRSSYCMAFCVCTAFRSVVRFRGAFCILHWFRSFIASAFFHRREDTRIGVFCPSTDKVWFLWLMLGRVLDVQGR